MKIRESVGQSIWNTKQGWCCQPLDPIPVGDIALAIEADSLSLVDWDIEEIGEKAGFDIQYRYTGTNDPKKSSLACVTQFVGIYSDKSKMYRDVETLTKAGIPRHLFKILISNEDIQLKPFTMETAIANS
ncbi:hypothetical protein [Limnofasciculus baicalensis]|uniref:Uncharacterized protein n=1 Tax=Limnofasciculus baicalensis BBK-W-15 TaxID=2699891 RepID=A0AAE3GQA3_9CYAN|nr:hypothetical protein [Limnofasciculus baicalensis]MCP2728082.1 hypothetical protein [Limnofasciculus baicalensis BBK-W-15]